MKIVSFCLALVLTAVFCGCGKGKDSRPALVMVTTANFPPYDYKVGSNVIGVDVDIVSAICEKTDRRLIVKEVPFNTLISQVISRKADLAASGITVTPERKQYVLFTVPYRIVSQQIIVMSGNETIRGPEDLKKNVRIGCQTGTTGRDFVRREILPTPDSPLLHEFESPSLAVEALKVGIIDAVVLDDVPARALAHLYDGTVKVLEVPLTQEEYAIAVNKDDKELCAAFDEAIISMKKYGTIERFFKKHKAILESLNK